MSKQKIILFISIFILLGGVVAFYFYVIGQKVDIEPEIIIREPKAIFEEKVQADLASFETPTSEAVIPRPAPDQTIKNDTEVQAEIDAYIVPQENKENTDTPSDQEILDLLNNPNFKAY